MKGMSKSLGPGVQVAENRTMRTGASRYFKALYSFVRDENEPGEMSLQEGEMLRLNTPTPAGDWDAGDRDGWIFLQSLETAKEGYVPKDYTVEVPALELDVALEPLDVRNHSSISDGDRAKFRALHDPPAPVTATLEQSHVSSAELTAYVPRSRRSSTALAPSTACHDDASVSSHQPGSLGGETGLRYQCLSGRCDEEGVRSMVMHRLLVASSSKAVERPPALKAAVEAEDYDGLGRKNEDFYLRMKGQYNEASVALLAATEHVANRINNNAVEVEKLNRKLLELDAIIDQERRQRKHQLEIDEVKASYTRYRPRAASPLPRSHEAPGAPSS